MRAGHTPGPWSVGKKYTTDVYPNIGSMLVARAMTGGISEAESDANARLIASAPDLMAERDRLKAANAELVAALESCAIHIEAMAAHIDHKPERFRAHCAQKAVDARAALTKNQEVTK